MAPRLNDILKLSVSERILWVEAIWDSIATDKKLINAPISKETKKLLDKRLAEHKANPSAGSSWDEVRARIEKSL